MRITSPNTYVASNEDGNRVKLDNFEMFCRAWILEAMRVYIT